MPDPLAPEGTLYSWFRNSARRHPEATAIEVAGEAVRYRELLDLVERLASRLVEAAGQRAAGSGRPPAAVGLLAGRSLAGYAGYLAALRLGATAVPLSPEAPASRIAWTCQQSEVDVVLVDRAGAGGRELAGRTGVATLTLEAAAGRPWYWSLDAPPWPEPYPGRPEDVAYLLFTSGSTGVPKGVPIRHRNLGPLLEHCIDQYALGSASRFGQASDLTFDGSVFGTFATWCAGGTLVVPQPEELLAPPQLASSRRLTHWYSVPSVISFARRSGMLAAASMPELRWSFFGGEQLTVAQARAWAAAAPGSVIGNLYGPTEVTVTCAEYLLPPDPAHWPVTRNGTVPIGPVLPHLESLILAGDGTAGAEGELCVRGPQRFDGYLDPEHDRGQFVHFDGQRARPHDGSAPPASAWYRTGDRVCTGPDGALVHLGRLDDQLQIRGHRVEPGEVESTLRGHPAILDVVVLATADRAGLQAVYTGRPVPAGELAALAAEWLPPYLRPQQYRWIEQLPVNHNGKVDRRRLATELPAPPVPPG